VIPSPLDLCPILNSRHAFASGGHPRYSSLPLPRRCSPSLFLSSWGVLLRSVDALDDSHLPRGLVQPAALEDLLPAPLDADRTGLPYHGQFRGVTWNAQALWAVDLNQQEQKRSHAEHLTRGEDLV
jgi:hypothetical protein